MSDLGVALLSLLVLGLLSLVFPWYASPGRKSLRQAEMRAQTYQIGVEVYLPFWLEGRPRGWRSKGQGYVVVQRGRVKGVTGDWSRMIEKDFLDATRLASALPSERAGHVVLAIEGTFGSVEVDMWKSDYEIVSACR